MKNSFKSGSVLAAVLVVALLAMATAVLAMPVPTAAPCFNGVQDGNETGVDCGGGCSSAYSIDYCDGKDNDLDCLVDEDCKQDVADVAQSCHDGFKNQDEIETDCGGVCTLNVKEICYDGVDNNNDCIFEDGCYRECLSDEKGNCLEVIRTSPQAAGNSQPIEQETTESSTSPIEQETTESSTSPEQQPVSYPAQMDTPAELIPATPAPTPDELAALTDEQIDAFIEQNGGTDLIKQVRKLAEEKGVYVPKDESDLQFGRKYVRYFFKHQSELAARFEGKEQTEEDFVGFLEQFSEEAYPKPVQTQSFFSKVAGFFKGLFS